jgi:hypothetical protein
MQAMPPFPQCSVKRWASRHQNIWQISACHSSALDQFPRFRQPEGCNCSLELLPGPRPGHYFRDSKDSLSASILEDLFSYLSPRFLNYLIEQFAKRRNRISDALLGCCIHELRDRKLRMHFSTFETVKQSFSNLRFQFKISERGFVTPEMAKPIASSKPKN